MDQLNFPRPRPAAVGLVAADRPPPPTDLVGPGDVLEINVYEAGVTLFASNTAGSGQANGGASPGVQVQKLPSSRVDDNGDIIVPYAGKIHVAGRTVEEVQTLIQRSLRRLSQNPQIIVTLSQAITNSIIVGGEVARPGRLLLQTNRETVEDVIALSGGYRGNARDLVLRLTRGTQSYSLRLSELVEQKQSDVRVLPGDKIILLSSPLSYSVLGASGRVDQIPFSRSSVTLAEAIAAAGGVNPNSGDPASIFLFRYEPGEGASRQATVYHLNMSVAGAYFLAQRFDIQDGDVLYFGNAASNRPARLFQLVSQLFTPVLSVTAAVQTVQNSR